jgi:hypothetical protein
MRAREKPEPDGGGGPAAGERAGHRTVAPPGSDFQQEIEEEARPGLRPEGQGIKEGSRVGFRPEGPRRLRQERLAK